MKKFKWINHSDLAITKTPTVGRREYLDYMTFQKNERPLFTEIFGPLIGLKEEWEEQGATQDELNFSAFPYRCERRGFLSINTGRDGGFPEIFIEETDEFQLFKDPLGRLMKLSKGYATLPLPQNYPVKTIDDWLKIKPWYRFTPSRFSKHWEDEATRYRLEDRVICVSIPGGFDEIRQLIGEEMLCLAFYDKPDLIHEILNTMSETAFQVLEFATQKVEIDLLFIHEDMAGKSGPMIGPNLVREFILPYYKKIWSLLQERGASLFDQDSDGDMNVLIPVFLEAGINCMHPMEPAANMDIVKIRQKYGSQLAFYGGINKHILRQNKEDIMKELEYKIPPMVKSGGCALALDHRIPNGTPLENYRFYIHKSWEIMNRETGR